MRSTTVAFFAVSAFVLLLCSAEEIKPAEVTCLRGCTKEYNPVCAKQGRKSRQFGNECMWKNYNCENTQDVYPDMEPGKCPE